MMAAYSTCAALEEKQQWSDEVIKECTFIERHTLKNLLLFSFFRLFFFSAKAKDKGKIAKT